MIKKNEDLRQRLHFIDRTIFHAVCACHADATIPDELQDCVQQLGWRSSLARRALLLKDAGAVRDNIDHLASLSQRAQSALENDSINYAVKSAVILTHIELSALRHQLD